MPGSSLGPLALVLLAAFAAAGLLVALLARVPQLRLIPRALRPDPLLAGVGLASVTGAAGVLAAVGPGAIAWWWVAAVVAAGLHWAEARLTGSGGMFSGLGRFGHVLGTLAGFAGLVAAVFVGALLHTQQAAELLRDGLGLAPRAAGPLLAGLLALALLARARAREDARGTGADAPGEAPPVAAGVVAVALLLSAFLVLALAAALVDPAATQAGLSAMVQGAWSSEAAAGGLLLAAGQAVLWSSLAAGPGLGAAGDDQAPRIAAAPLAAIAATLTALLVAAAGDPAAALTEPAPAALERHLGAGLQPSEYGQTIIVDPAISLEPGQKYEVVLRADPRGNRAGELLPADNIVALPAWDAAADADAIILRDSDPKRAENPGFDVRIACTREVVKTRIGTFFKLRPVDPNINIHHLMRARDLVGPFIPMRDIHFLGSVRTGVAIGTTQARLLLYEEPRQPDAPFNPPLRDLVTMGYAGPYLDPGGATEGPPVALVSAADFSPAPGERLHLRLDAPERGLDLGFVNRLGELEVPPWDFLAGARTAVLRHKSDPAQDLEVPVVSRLAFGRLRFSSTDPALSFDDLKAFPEHTGPHLVPPSHRFAAEVRTGTRLPAEFADRRALIALHPDLVPSGNPGAALYTPHPAEVLLAGMRGPVRDQTGAAEILPGLHRRLGRGGAIAGTLMLAGLALAGLVFWLRCGQRWAVQAFGGGGAGLVVVFLAGISFAPACDPTSLLRAGLPALALTAIFGLTAILLQVTRLTRRP